LALALAGPLRKQALGERDYLDLMAAEGTSSGTVQVAGGHDFIKVEDGPEMAAEGRKLFYHYVETYFKTGTPEIIWPVP